MDETVVNMKIEPFEAFDFNPIKVDPDCEAYSDVEKNCGYHYSERTIEDSNKGIKLEPIDDVLDTPETLNISDIKKEMGIIVNEDKSIDSDWCHNKVVNESTSIVNNGNMENSAPIEAKKRLGRPPHNKKVFRFTCTTCYFKTNHKVSFGRHQRQHKDSSAVEIFHCDKCTFTTKWKTSMITHAQLHIEESPLQCIYCNFKGKNMISFRVHIQTHMGSAVEESLTCRHCEFKTKYSNHLIFHNLMHMNLSDADAVRCEQCGFVAKHSSVFDIHMQMHNISETQKTKVYYREFIKCDQCPFQTLTMDTMKKHLLSHKDLSEVESYSCQSCSYSTKWKSSMKRHMLRHTEDFPFQCEVCGYRAKHKSAMTVHMLTHDVSGDTPTMYFCYNCAFVSKRKGSLITHMKKHFEWAYMKCDKCDFQCVNKHYMKKHKLKHDLKGAKVDMSR